MLEPMPNRVRPLRWRALSAWLVLWMWTLACAVFAPPPTDAHGTGTATYHVAPGGSDVNPGTQAAPWRTIRRASEQLMPGDTLLIREGVYNEQIIPLRSGTAERPITYRAFPGEQPIIDGQNAIYRNIEVVGLGYIVFDGLRVQDPVDEWAHVERSHHITFTNMHFTNVAIRDRNFQGINFRYSSYNRVLESTLENWGAYLPDGDRSGNHIRIFGDEQTGGYNLIEGNRFIRGAQGCIMINGPFNIVRNNVFDNDWQKGVHVGYFDQNIGNEPPGTVFYAAHNLIEGNTFLRHGLSRFQHGGVGYEESGVGSIFRRNVVRNADTTGAIFAAFGDYAWRATHNHWYHNTLVNNGEAGLECSGTGISGGGEPSTAFHSNVIKNNIIFGNHLTCNGTTDQLSVYFSVEIANPPDLAPPLYGTIIAGNLIENRRAAQCSADLRDGLGDGNCNIYIPLVNEADVTWFEASFPAHFWGNLEADPAFVAYDPVNERFDLRLLPTSPAIDAGVPLTVTLSAGSGILIPVEDAWYFHDGYDGMIEPDTIQIGTERVRILSIDYVQNTISVDRVITWAQGAPVSLPYAGDGPDIGAFEYDPGARVP